MMDPSWIHLSLSSQRFSEEGTLRDVPRFDGVTLGESLSASSS